jgi:hypothetical protein
MNGLWDKYYTDFSCFRQLLCRLQPSDDLLLGYFYATYCNTLRAWHNDVLPGMVPTDLCVYLPLRFAKIAYAWVSW